MTINVGDVVRIAITGGGPQSSIWQNVWHYEMTVGNPRPYADVLTAIKNNYITTWATIDQLVSNQYQVSSIEMWEYNFALHKWNGVGVQSFAPLVGLSTSEPAAHGTCAVGYYVTEVSRREGRTFLPGVTGNQIINGLWNSTVVTAMLLYMDDFTNDVDVTGSTMKLSTFNTDDSSPYYETTSNYAGTRQFSNIPGYQRRRKPGVGL